MTSPRRDAAGSSAQGRGLHGPRHDSLSSLRPRGLPLAPRSLRKCVSLSCPASAAPLHLPRINYPAHQLPGSARRRAHFPRKRPSFSDKYSYPRNPSNSRGALASGDNRSNFLLPVPCGTLTVSFGTPNLESCNLKPEARTVTLDLAINKPLHVIV